MFKPSGVERKAARLLREMRVYVRPRRLKAEEAHGPPLDKRVPAVESNGQYIKQKNCRQNEFVYSLTGRTAKLLLFL
ncbi:hypothetical protein [Peribacillus muralis]|uniref:hypothetical protein n=1 Tax=Peribacillus muralis TaxID=264697 RepID=UPI0036705247